MAKKDPKDSKPRKQPSHPGSSTEEAKSLGGKGDFGVAESDLIERAYTSANTRQADPGGAEARSGSDQSRVSGVGGNESGVGSSSGGDLDTDVIGIGNGRGVAASGKIHEPPGADDATGTSRDFASGPPARGANSSPRPTAVHGSTVGRGDDNTTGARGADSATPLNADNDAFAGEVSSSEASGENDAGD